jgi:predicted dehydrogenase
MSVSKFTEVGHTMETTQRGWRLAIVGEGHRRRYFQERWQLLNPARIVTVTDKACNAVLIVAPLSTRGALVKEFLAAGLSVVVETPIAATLSETRELFALAESRQVALRMIALRQTESDYQAAQTAIASGRLGTLVSLRWQAAEYAVWAGDAAGEYRRGETLSVGSPPLFDQLTGLVTSTPRTIRGQSYAAEDGFAAEFTFEDGCEVRIELRRTARAGLRTGWIIEGTAGAYHHRKLITTTADGELVDEPVSFTPSDTDPVQELEAMESLLPMSAVEQHRCLQTAGLFEAVQRSIATGQPIEWASL